MAHAQLQILVKRTYQIEKGNSPSSTYQVVNGVIRPHLAALDEPLCERGHHVLHQVVAQRDRLRLQLLVLLTLYIIQLLRLSGNTSVRYKINITQANGFNIRWKLTSNSNILLPNVALILQKLMNLTTAFLMRLKLLEWLSTFLHKYQINIPRGGRGIETRNLIIPGQIF